MKRIINREELEAKIEELYWDFDYFGIRFDGRTLQLGDTLGNSKDNPDREDERDFPEYDSDEYDDLPELDGTSAWSANAINSYRWIGREEYFDDDQHCYLIAGNYYGQHPCPDDHEILIREPKVVGIIF